MSMLTTLTEHISVLIGIKGQSIVEVNEDTISTADRQGNDSLKNGHQSHCM